MRFALLVAVGALTLACAEPSAPTTDATAAGGVSVVRALGVGNSAVMAFGKGVGSPFDPASGHDMSFHSYDKVRPRTVTIAAGGSVTFQIGPFHQVSIYPAGTEPGDIDVSAFQNLTAPFFIPDFLITPSAGLIEANDLSTTLSFIPQEWNSSPGTFATPGTYLVLCRVAPHFLFASMYGYVIVK